jgi:hypothetical protein
VCGQGRLLEVPGQPAPCCSGPPAYLRTMPKMIKKSDLPQKTCATCGRPFVWRKKWAKVWEQVRYCSDKCRDKR